MPSKRARTVAQSAAYFMIVVSALWSIVFALQPWRVCMEDDSAMGCPALPRDTILMTIGVVVFIVACGAALCLRQGCRIGG